MAIPLEKQLSDSFTLSVLGAGALAALLSVVAGAAALNTVQNFVAGERATDRRITQIEQESEINQALYERTARTGVGVSLTGYLCDPISPPDFDSVPWAREKDLPVRDRHSTLTGYVKPDGTYTHLGYCSPN